MAKDESASIQANDWSLPFPQVSPDTIYATVAARRNSYDSMMWQVPSLAIAAQALVLTAALDPGRTSYQVAVLLGAGACIGLLSAVLMTKQRFHERVDTEFLKAWEERLEFLPMGPMLPHSPALAKSSRRHPWLRYHQIVRDVEGSKASRLPVQVPNSAWRSSADIWIRTLWALVALDLLVGALLIAT